VSHYTMRLLENVQIAASPLWMQNRLMAAGIRPINNVVDITNYVMLEYGQPLHAFDAEAVANGRIDVRLAQTGERLVTLDDADRALEPDMLLITDGTKPIGLAGVMGGANSEVSGGTRRILLESAKFSGSSVRKTSRRLGLRSEASLRFEKEVNPEAVVDALNRAASLMCRYAGAQAAAGIVEEKTRETESVRIELDLGKINGYLGTALTLDTVKEIMGRLHFDFEPAGSEGLIVTVPSRRGDITRSVDLIEEIARLYGYDNIPTTLMTGVTTPGSLNPGQKVRRALRTLLTESGFHEVVTYSFTHPDAIAQFRGMYPDAKTVALSMPMSEDRSTLRTSLVPHLLDAAVYNRYRSEEEAAIFEIGKVFLADEEKMTKLPEEKLMLSMLLTGNRTPIHWSAKPEKADFYDLKGVFEKAVSFLGIEGVEYHAAQPEGFHPGRTAEISVRTGDGRTVIGRLGQLHPEIQLAKDLEDTYVLEADLNLLAKYVTFTMDYKMLPRYPAVSRDLALVVDRGVEVGALEAKARETAGDLLESVTVFDVYTGERLGSDKKSVALSFVYRHADRTLTDEEIGDVTGKVIEDLTQTFAAELRK
jgi:phenylalanyl-tRNA synthetase beta chain